MSMDMGGAKGGVKSEINVTPLVDVMLVLLIIMMVIAPMLQQGVPVELPAAVNSTDKPDTSDQTIVNIDRQGELYVNSLPVTEAQLIDRVKGALEGKKEHIVYLKGDKETKYGQIMKMMDALRAAQIESVSLITERPGGNSKAGGK
ncbi:MAG: biopolymer transporter ExbD [Acidobacteriota bacterium]